MWLEIGLWGNGLDSDEKILFSEIITLCSLPEGCHASDKHFAELLECDRKTANRKIQKLKKRGIVTITKIRKGKTYERIITC